MTAPTDRAYTSPAVADERWARSATTSRAPGRDGRALTALRVVAYLLTSVASALFIALVVYGAILFSQFQQAVQEFSDVMGDLGSTPPASVTEPGFGSGPLFDPTDPAFCTVVPDDPACAPN